MKNPYAGRIDVAEKRLTVANEAADKARQALHQAIYEANQDSAGEHRLSINALVQTTGYSRSRIVQILNVQRAANGGTTT